MTLVTMRQLLDEAAAGGYGVAAFNVNNREQTQRIMEAAQETQPPVIVQASRGAGSYTGADLAVIKEVVDHAHGGGVGKAARAGQKLICAQRMQELGMAGHAGDYTPMSLEEMAERYAYVVRPAA